MPLSQRINDLRKDRITGSRSAAVLGMSRYKTRGDVYCDIKGLSDFDGNDATAAGEILERAVLDYGGIRLGCRYNRRNLFRVSDDLDYVAATLDATLPDRPGEIMQAKTTGITHFVGRDDLAEWGQEETDQIPQEYVIQCQHELFVAGAMVNWVPVLIGGIGFRLYRVERNEALLSAMLDGYAEFHAKHIIPSAMPTDSLPCLATLKALPRLVGKTVPMDYSLIAQWLDDKAARLAAEKAEEASLQTILAAIGDAEAGDCQEGQFRYVWEGAGKRLDMDRLRAERPEIYAEYAADAQRRVPRFKATKKGRN